MPDIEYAWLCLPCNDGLARTLPGCKIFLMLAHTISTINVLIYLEMQDNILSKLTHFYVPMFDETIPRPSQDNELFVFTFLRSPKTLNFGPGLSPTHPRKIPGYMYVEDEDL